MKKILLSVIALGSAFSAHASVAPDSKNFNASFWAPSAQLVPASEDISGVRLNFIYGENRNVNGVDIGIANSVSKDMNGLQFSLFLPCVYNYVGGKMNGVQLGWVNRAGDEFNGYQSGLVNQTAKETNGVSAAFVNYNSVADSKLCGVDWGFVNWTPLTDVQGVQLGFVNLAHDVTGVQFGFVNISRHLKGVQLGLWNQVSERGWGEFSPLPKVFPFINLGW